MMDPQGPDPQDLIPNLVLFPLIAVIPLDTGAEMIMCVDTVTLWVTEVMGPALACSSCIDHGLATAPALAAETHRVLSSM